MTQNRPNIVIGMTDLGSTWFKRYMKGKYIKSLRQSGAVTRLFPWTLTEKDADVLVAECDGILLPGGADIDPACYGQEKRPYCHETVPTRDKGEIRVLSAALKAKKPVLGICRGCQIINCYFGGTLYQDIVEDAGASCLNHMDAKNHAKPVHSITITPKTLLAEAMISDSARVNTLHHQGICQLGAGLIASAISEDAIIEALECPDYPFLLGVQWHPEHTFKAQIESRNIFNLFISSCKETHF